MKPLLSVLVRLLAAGAVDARLLPILHRGTVNPGNGSVQLLVHGAVENRPANVVSEVKGPDEEDVDAADGCDLLHLIISRVH